ncbi:hypothetical protein B0G52_13743 [Cohnella sp. SGD-V74]|jgi:hypothetical protein|uniref:hypothetical protein n=1 Tax=unclassified Cohnella TaxID=2636738 RepID=UPI000D42A6F0|nr:MULTISPECIES: hypothetical protein [unclassified Cohnella]PRX58017.1 hypothetical protein B0G52_13743 [Cohnella sp. SGD-V74]
MLLHEYTAYKILESDRILLERALEFHAKAFENEAVPSRKKWVGLLTILFAANYFSK